MLTVAMCREFKEELNIGVEENDLKFMTIGHRKDVIFGTIYYDIYFFLNFWEHLSLTNQKNVKKLEGLPSNLIGDRAFAL